jgi:hypothetical protein
VCYFGTRARASLRGARGASTIEGGDEALKLP